MLRFPSRRGSVQRLENASDLLRRRFRKPAAMSAVKLLNLRATEFYVGKAAARIQPKFLASCWVPRRLNRRMPKFNLGCRLVTVLFCRRDTDSLRVAFSQRALLSPNLFA